MKTRKQSKFKQNLEYQPKLDKYRQIITELQTKLKKKVRNERIVYFTLIGADVVFALLMCVFFDFVVGIMLGLVFLIIPSFSSYMIEKDVIALYKDLLSMINLDNVDVKQIKNIGV